MGQASRRIPGRHLAGRRRTGPWPVLPAPAGSSSSGRLAAAAGGHSPAAPPRPGTGSPCPSCQSPTGCASGRSGTAHTARRPLAQGSSPDPNDAARDQTRLRGRRGLLTWCLLSISRPSSMSMGCSSSTEKEEVRNTPSISICTAGEGQRVRTGKLLLVDAWHRRRPSRRPRNTVDDNVSTGTCPPRLSESKTVHTGNLQGHD